ncbi:MAG: transporter suffix domain-containing protein [Scytolyngbya sp. HA4215-MV1]|nr:transporter suffix domain-containing protein [Scytolyngbya sp. HA4215-MV1]
MKYLGFGLISLSLGLWGLLLVVPWLPATIAQKTIVATTFVVVSEIFWWTGVLLLGKEVAKRYRHKLNLGQVWQRLKQSLRR